MIEDQKKRKKVFLIIIRIGGQIRKTSESTENQCIFTGSSCRTASGVVSAVIDYDDLYEPIAEGFLENGMSLLSEFCWRPVLAVVSLWQSDAVICEERCGEIDDLKELNEQLEKMHRSEENIAHQQRLQIMGTMTGGIAHEFNNFLTPIMGYAELLMMELPEGSEEQDSAKEIYDASEKAKDVVRQISSLSRKNVETVYKSIPMKKIDDACTENDRVDLYSAGSPGK